MNEHVIDLLALYALGGLEPDELKTVSEHLAVCDACRAEADRQQALVAVLASSAPARAPDPRLRAAILAKAGITPQPGPTPRAQPKPPQAAQRPTRQPWRPAWSRWLMAGLAAVMVGLIGWNVYLTGELVTLQRRVQYNQNALALIAGPDTAHVPLAGQGAFATSGGNAYIDQNTMEVVLVVQKLQPLADNQTYQAWIISGQGPTSAGLFRVSDTGWGMTWLNAPYVQGGKIGVSLEPNGGSPQPTRVVLLSTQ